MLRVAVTLTLALAVSSSAWSATRVLNQLETPYELALAQVNLPTTADGTLSFRPCDSCRIIAHALSSGTHYFVSGRELAFPDFTKAVNEIRRTAAPGASIYVGVFIGITSQQVDRIVVWPPRG